ncbi:MAG: choice-of-anchor B family protein [bacterium]
MKKLIILILLLCSFTFISKSYSQLPNQNMYVLSNLNQHASTNPYSALWGYKAPDGREYAILGCSQGTAFVDITDSANIHEVDFLTGPSSSWREMKTYSHYAYIVSEAANSGVQIVDLQYLPDSIHLVKKFVAPSHSSTHSISQSGPYLYLNGCNSSFVGNGGIVIFDLTVDPETPVVRGKWTSLYVHDCRIVDDTIFAANINNEKVSVINATNKTSLSSITSFVNLPGSGPHNTALTSNKKRLFVTDEIGSVTPHLLKIWNIEDFSNITYVTNWQPTGITTSIVHNIEIYGSYAVVAHYTAGVRIIDIANPDSPQEVAWYDTYPSNNAQSYNGCWGVYMFPSGKIIASDRQTGLYVLKSNLQLTGVGNNIINTIPENYSLEQNFPNPFNPTTNIKFSLPENSIVKLNVFNIAGQEVAQLLNENRNAGNYDISFDANRYGLTSGLYFYTLTAGYFNETKKMILLK